MSSIKLAADLKFENLPQRLTRGDYQEVLDLAVQDLEKNKDVAAIYVAGQNWVPGISDLDVVVVYKDGVSKIHPRHPCSLSEKAQYIFIHDYMHFNESLFKNIHYIYPVLDLHLLHGQAIERSDPRKELSPREYKLLRASLAMDFLVTKLLLFFRHFMVKSVNTRTALPSLYSFIYTIEMVEEIIGRKLGGDFPQKIKALKSQWFKGPNLKLLGQAMGEGLGVAAELVGALDDFFKTTFGLQESGLCKLTVPNFYIVGMDKWNKKEFLENLSSGYVKISHPISGKRLKSYKLLVPNSFFAIFSLYARERGPYSDWFRRFLKCPGLSVGESRGIAKRMEVLNRVPLKEDGRVLFTLPIHYGFNTTNYDREALKVKLVSLLRFLKP